MPGAGPGDNVAFLWNFWWMRHALASSGEHVFHTTFLFYPFGTDLVLHTHTASTSFLGATLLSSVSIVAAQNIAIVGSYALNGFAAYLLAWRLTRHRGASLAAGLFFQAAPYFSGHLYGHFNLIAGWVLPLFALAWLRALGAGSASAAALAALALVVAAFTDYYYATYLSIFAVCVLVSRWIDIRVIRGRTVWRQSAIDSMLVATLALIAALIVFTSTTGGGTWSVGGATISMRTDFNLRTAGWFVGIVWLWRRWRPRPLFSVRRPRTIRRDLHVVSAASIVVFAGTAPIWLAVLRLWRGGGYVSQQYFWHSAPAGIDLAGFLCGNPFHPIWGHAIERFLDARGIATIDRTAWFGIAPIVWLLLTRTSWIRHRASGLWMAVAALFLVWSLGPYLTVLGFNTGLPLPGILLRYVPVVANARIPGRAIVMVYLSLSMLLAIATASGRFAARPSTIWLLCLAMLCDFAAAPVPLFALDRPEVYRDLASLPRGAVMELPFGVRDGFGETGALDARTLFYQSIHGNPIVGGFVARLSPAVATAYSDSRLFGPLLRLSAGERVRDQANDDPAAATLLKHYAIRYVVLNTKTASEDLRAHARSQMPTALIKAYADGRELYVVK